MIADLAASGLDAKDIAFRLDMGVAAVRKVLAGEPPAPRGRPALVVPTPEEARKLKAAYVKSNRCRGKGSMTLAARMLAQTDPEIRPELKEAILKPRASKHILTSVIKREMHVSTHVVNFHRSPRDLSLSLGDVPGQLRMHPSGRLLRAGERESWDDATINFVVCVPWPWKGEHGQDKCAERYGVRLGRFQLLCGVDDASQYCPSFTFTIRPHESYRAADLVAACGRTWRDGHAPLRTIWERAIWESHQSTEFLRQVGVEVDRAHSPHTKLVESFWNRLWSPLSLISGGQIGRYRGEMERENKLLVACKKGHQDPREIFPMLNVAMDSIEQAIRYLNHEPIESKTYGTWVPSERYARDLAEHPRPALDPGMFWAWAPVQKEWIVRGGLVGGKIPSQVGFSFPYKFADPALLELEGVRVRVFFDPHDASQRAGIVLADNHRGRKAGTVITDRAVLISDVPTATEQAATLAAGRTFGGFDRAIKARNEYAALVRSEYRYLGIRDEQRKTMSEIRDGLGNVARMETGSRPVELTTSRGSDDLSSRIPNSPGQRLNTPEAAPRINARAALLEA